MNKRTTLSTLLAAATMTSVASAVSVTIPFNSHDRIVVSGTTGFGNEVTFQEPGGGHTVTVHAQEQYDPSGNGSKRVDTFRDGAELGVYSNGLGVTNTYGDHEHTVDNAGWDDRVVFSFGEDCDVALTAARLVAYGDTDITIWYQDGNDIWQVLSPAVNEGGSSSREAVFNSGLQLSDTWAISGTLPSLDTEYNDAFKIKSITFHKPDNPGTPEAGHTALLFGMTLLGMGTLRRRARRK